MPQVLALFIYSVYEGWMLSRMPGGYSCDSCVPQVQQKCDDLQKRQTEAILDVQQKSSLKDILLERKIKAVTKILEKERLKLWVALAFGQGDQTAAKSIKIRFYTCTYLIVYRTTQSTGRVYI